MTIIEGVRALLAGCSLLPDAAPVYVDGGRDTPVYLSIVPIPGSRIVREYLDGAQDRAYPFSLRFSEYTHEDQDRLTTAGFFEQFADWLENNLPEMGDNQTAEKMQITSSGFLFEQDTGQQTGIYAMDCLLTYYQEAV